MKKNIIQFGAGHRNETHVVGQRGVSGEIKTLSCIPNHKTTGIAAIAAVGQNRAVYCVDVFDGSEIEVPLSAVVYRMPFESLVFKPGYDLEIRYYESACAPGDGFHIGHMVAMPMRYQDGICLNFRYIYMRSQAVGTDKRVEKEPAFAQLHTKTGVTVIGNFDGCSDFGAKVGL